MSAMNCSTGTYATGRPVAFRLSEAARRTALRVGLGAALLAAANFGLVMLIGLERLHQVAVIA